MPREDVVSYLQQNLKKFPMDALRKQLATEGITDAEFDEALKLAMRAPKAPPRRFAGGTVILALGALVGMIGGVIVMRGKPAEDPAAAPSPVPKAPDASAFIGHYGYLVRLPTGYEALPTFKDSQKSVEVVHIFPKGTDPTNFVNEGLYGQLGIVKMEVRPDVLAGQMNGLETLTRWRETALQNGNEKYSAKPIKVPPLSGTQFFVQSPFPRVEAYILGEKNRYSFTAGQDDEIFREIVFSLRDTVGEM